MPARSAKILIVHLATFTRPRLRKAMQIFIRGVPNSGKTTLRELIEHTLYPLTFHIAGESSKNFTTAGFQGKAPNSIWVHDEAHREIMTSISAADFNRIP
jgi:hypothetical protein